MRVGAAGIVQTIPWQLRSPLSARGASLGAQERNNYSDRVLLPARNRDRPLPAVPTNPGTCQFPSGYKDRTDSNESLAGTISWPLQPVAGTRRDPGSSFCAEFLPVRK